jgi:hypothetical protein
MDTECGYGDALSVEQPGADGQSRRREMRKESIQIRLLHWAADEERFATPLHHLERR